MEQPFIDIHTHGNGEGAGDFFIRNLHQKEKDTCTVEQFKACSVGLHPWFIHPDTYESDWDWLLDNAPKANVLCIGECGLDRLTDVDWDFQTRVFLEQVDLSEKLEKPLLLHCVRAHEAVIAFKKQKNPRQNWIFHGFDKNKQMAYKCLQAGCFLSFGAALLRENGSLQDVFREMPLEKIFLETDDKTSISIKTIYDKAADLRGIPLAELKSQILRNFSAVFDLDKRMQRIFSTKILNP